MVSKCANPACKARFKRLHEGRLFHFEVVRGNGHGPHLVDSRKAPAKVEHFWLCSNCSAQMTVKYDKSKGILVVPFAGPSARVAAAS